jgi:hypothetical protein
MGIPARVQTDLVEELRLRRWAREHYVATGARDATWHTIILDEMRRRDDELAAADAYADVTQRIVPLVPDLAPTLRGPHADLARPPLRLCVPALE